MGHGDIVDTRSMTSLFWQKTLICRGNYMTSYLPNVISKGYVCEKICGAREWVSIRVLGYMYVMYIREYIYYLVSLVFSSLFREDVHVGRMVEGVGSREARACDLTKTHENTRVGNSSDASQGAILANDKTLRAFAFQGCEGYRGRCSPSPSLAWVLPHF